MKKNSVNNYNIGPLFFSIEGSNGIAEAIFLEFESFVDYSQEKKPSLRFIFDSNINENEFGVVSEPVVSYEQSYKARHSGLIYLHKKLNSDHREITVDIDPQSFRSLSFSLVGKIFIRKIFKFINWNYLTPEEILAKNFLYDIFDYISQIELLTHNASYIHASAFARDDQCILITGRGGIGKSSLLLKYVIEKKWHYISDDLAIIGENRKIWRTPKKLQIYGYNLEGEKNISDALLKNRDIFDLLAWHLRLYLKGIKRVRRRVAACELFGDSKVLDFSYVSKIFFLERTESTVFFKRSMDIEELSARSAYILLSEIDPFTNISLALHAAGNRELIPNFSNFFSLTEEIYLKNLKNIDCFLVSVPSKATPGDLVSFFSELLSDHGKI